MSKKKKSGFTREDLASICKVFGNVAKSSGLAVEKVIAEGDSLVIVPPDLMTEVWLGTRVSAFESAANTHFGRPIAVSVQKIEEPADHPPIVASVVSPSSPGGPASKRKAAATASSKQPELPLFPEGVAAMPNRFSKTALFGLPPVKGPRPFHQKTELYSINGYKLEFTGEELCVNDQTAWLACVRMLRGQPYGQGVPFHPYSMLREMGLSDSAANALRLRERLERLSRAVFKISHTNDVGQEAFAIGTLLSFTKDYQDQKWKLSLNANLAPYFLSTSYQQWDIRLSLKTELSTWLLSFIMGYRRETRNEVNMDVLMKLCGASSFRHFKGRLREAFQDLHERKVVSHFEFTKKAVAWISPKFKDEDSSPALIEAAV